jgi:hypothetical protein
MKPTRGTDKVNPAIAIALLHSLRATDTPDEVIEDESFRLSLPRRLGLNEVVDAQMRRYAEIRDRRGVISPDEYGNLLQLIDRRPDAVAVFSAAGRNLAEARFSEATSFDRFRSRFTPRRLRRRKLIRAMSSVARALEPGAPILPVAESEADGIDVLEPPLAITTADGAGCALMTAALDVCAVRVGHATARLNHVQCVGRGDDRCRWLTSEPDPPD